MSAQKAEILEFRKNGIFTKHIVNTQDWKLTPDGSI